MATDIQKRVAKVLERIAEACAKDELDAEMYAESMEEMLTELHQGDCFGTEGQCDPRGDFREYQWSMDFVEGVDTP